MLELRDEARLGKQGVAVVVGRTLLERLEGNLDAGAIVLQRALAHNTKGSLAEISLQRHVLAVDKWHRAVDRL